MLQRTQRGVIVQPAWGAAVSRLCWSNEVVPPSKAAAVSVLILLVTTYAVFGDHWGSGPELFELTSSHGIHFADVAVAAVAAVAVALTWRSVRR